MQLLFPIKYNEIFVNQHVLHMFIGPKPVLSLFAKPAFVALLLMFWWWRDLAILLHSYHGNRSVFP